MRSNIKSKLFGNLLSDGSFKFLLLGSANLSQSLKVKRVDPNNHSVWTGQRSKEQTEIFAFIDRFNKKKG
uniref:Ribosomal protein L31 n=1 Tax=Cladosiphon okamuranus TaxID=309737 RepID=A0A3G5FPL5_9PHAE|nr:ribosomal protein L31 [Cladosiphon okamuranus]AYW52579.1 ribosomal protein L31 [Cladosiphon okamuranus]